MCAWGGGGGGGSNSHETHINHSKNLPQSGRKGIQQVPTFPNIFCGMGSGGILGMEREYTGKSIPIRDINVPRNIGTMPECFVNDFFEGIQYSVS